jgi:hypothetical protein
MTKADIDLAHKTVGDIGHCVRAMEQYGNTRIASVLRIAASLLQKMVDEHERDEQLELSLSPSDVYRKGLTGDING